MFRYSHGRNLANEQIMISIEEPLASWILLVARVCLASVFLVSGVHKAVWYKQAVAEFKSAQAPLVSVTLPATIALHVAGSLSLILGVFTTEVAVVLAAFTLLATERAHGFWRYDGSVRLDRSRIAMANLGLTGGLLLLAVTGAGRLALG
jgi:putative oxidoreductase